MILNCSPREVVSVEDYYMGWLNQLEKGLEEWGRVRLPGEYRLVVVAGMGGSGIVGDYVAALSSVRGVVPVIVSKSHLLPGFVGKNDLVFIVSYSGNTLETRIAYSEALQRGSRIVIVSSDGILEREASEKNIPFVPVVKGIAPRTALPHMLYGILGVLDSSGYSVVSKREAEDAYRFLAEYMGDIVDSAHRLASFIYEKRGLTIIATHTPLEPLGWRGKNEFNENAKIPVKVEVAPEWMHNDIVGWEHPFTNNYSVIALRDPDDKPGYRLVEFMMDIYSEKRIPVYTIDLRGSNLLEKLLYGSLLLGLASVKLARMRGLDPLATTSISKYKAQVDKIFT
jgi:glucose/mannose-6-phosphate isomerase